MVPLSYSYKWIGASWRIVKYQYWLSLIQGLMGALCFAVIPKLTSMIGVPEFIGAGIGTALGGFFIIGSILNCASWASGEKRNLGDLFIGFYNPELARRYLPVIVMNTVIAICNQQIVESFPEHGAAFYSLFGALTLFNVAVGLSGPLILFKKITLLEAIPISAVTMFKNIFPMILSGLILVAWVIPPVVVAIILTFAAAKLGISPALAGTIPWILIILPAILILAPMMFAYGYVVYVGCIEQGDPGKILRREPKG
jgi:hypothetical protein